MAILPRVRTRAAVETELADAIRRRDHAVRVLDFDAYEHLRRHIDGLLDELSRILPRPRGGA